MCASICVISCVCVGNVHTYIQYIYACNTYIHTYIHTHTSHLSMGIKTLEICFFYTNERIAFFGKKEEVISHWSRYLDSTHTIINMCVGLPNACPARTIQRRAMALHAKPTHMVWYGTVFPFSLRGCPVILLIKHVSHSSDGSRSTSSTRSASRNTKIIYNMHIHTPQIICACIVHR